MPPTKNWMFSGRVDAAVLSKAHHQAWHLLTLQGVQASGASGRQQQPRSRCHVEGRLPQSLPLPRLLPLLPLLLLLLLLATFTSHAAVGAAGALISAVRRPGMYALWLQQLRPVHCSQQRTRQHRCPVLPQPLERRTAAALCGQAGSPVHQPGQPTERCSLERRQGCTVSRGMLHVGDMDQ